MVRRRRRSRRSGGHHRQGNTLTNTFDGHGTPVAGVVAQFVPQATIEPVSIFQPFGFSVSLTVGTGTTGGAGGAGGGGGGAGGAGGGGLRAQP